MVGSLCNAIGNGGAGGADGIAGIEDISANDKQVIHDVSQSL